MNRLHGSRGAATPLPDKTGLRALMRRRRRGLARADPRASERLAQLGFPRIVQATRRPGVAAGYHALGSEIDPRPLLARLSEAGWRIALPRAIAADAPLLFLDAGAERSLDVFGISSPYEGAERLSPDLVLVPMLCFDLHGGRLGQGAGCYDRTLAALRAGGPVLAVGLAFAGQAVERVPTDEHDVPLDLVLTERGPVEVLR